VTDVEAYKIAYECILAAMRPIAFNANVALSDPNAPPVMKTHLERYKKLAEALKIIEGKKMQKRLLP
jgi:hypothetical protein